MSTLTRQRAAVATGLRTFLRERTNLALLVVLPPIVLLAFDISLETMGDAPGIEVPAAAAELGGALFATAFLAGLLGVFQVVGGAEPDRRLIVCGYRPWEVLTARLLTIVAASGLVTCLVYVTFRVLSDVTPQAPVLAIGALLIAAVTYGLLGVIIGSLVGRELEGSLVLVFLADFDAFAALGVIPIESDVVEYVPLAHPHTLLESAIHDGTIAMSDTLVAGAYVVVLAGVALAAVTIRGESA